MTGPSSNSSRTVAMSLISGGVATIVVAIILGATVEPALYAIALVGIVDFGLAWAFSKGYVGTGAPQRREAEASGDAATVATEDPSYNPYARED